MTDAQVSILQTRTEYILRYWYTGWPKKVTTTK